MTRPMEARLSEPNGEIMPGDIDKVTDALFLTMYEKYGMV